MWLPLPCKLTCSYLGLLCAVLCCYTLCYVAQLHVSYLGGSFSGWLRGNTHSKPAVQHSLGCAIAATGLTAKADTGGSRKAKRAVSRAARKAYTLELAAGGDEAVAAAAAAAVHAEAAEDSAAALQLQQPGCQVPFLLCAGRTDAGVSACAQVSSQECQVLS